jgi:hypothetical protein
MDRRPPLKSGDEVDVHGTNRRAHRWGRGRVSEIKRGTRRRERQLRKADTVHQLENEND